MLGNRPKVLVTGMGVVSVFGTTLEGFWKNLIDGNSGINKISHFDASSLPCQIAGEIHDFDPKDYLSHKEVRRTPKSSQIALAAAVNAVKDSGLGETMPEPERAGVVVGTALSGFDFVDISISTIREKGYKLLNPFTGLGIIPNHPAFLIGQNFQCQGPNSTVVTACAAGTQAIGEAAEVIRRGAADVVIAGGVDTLINDIVIGIFSGIRALPFNYNEDPIRSSRPFDAKREGFVPSEGAAVVILESEEHAKARDANVLAEVAGYASSSDAHHISAPSPDGAGPARAMEWAIEDAELTPEDIDYINAHGTSTPLNDVTETKAIKLLFRKTAYDVAISSTKSMIGHAMGASGALEAVACVMAINEGKIPPTINYENPDPELDLDYTPNKYRQMDVNVALNNSFGLGGQNACVVLKKYTE
ncbi:MAG: beta-ketoacyl-ACP synthase II [Anaerolineales bacterium]|jgi:beta-ketoacyl-acyl-carrier-protein synthase II